MHKVTVIMPSTGQKHRANSLVRAINSILDQKGVDAIPLVVLNGNKYDKDLRSSIETNKSIRFKYVEKGSLPNAIFEGRQLVDTEFYSFLDDDDIYTPKSLSARVTEFNLDTRFDVVVGNGYKIEGGKKYITYQSNKLLNEHPLIELTKRNWLASCAPLFKTDSIGLNFFNRTFKYYEWTYLAYKLCLSKKIRFIHDITYLVNSTDSSLSKSEEYILARPLLYTKLLELGLPDRIRTKIRKKEIQCYHSISSYYLNAKMRKKAWKWHVKSLKSFYGLKYLPYTKALL